MDVELFMSGTPAGESFWGKEEERKYFSTFYNGSKDKPKMLVQVRKAQSGKTYCYYNYLVYDGVVASDGRAGSFFCVSLRTDCYCREYGNMYSLLDGIFRERIAGHFLKKTQGDTLKYEIANFGSVSTEIEDIFDEIKRRMTWLFSAESFTGLDGFATQSSAIAKVNLCDCTEEKVAEYVKRYGAVELSPYFPTEKEMAERRETEEKKRTVNEEFERERGETDLDVEDKVKSVGSESEDGQSRLNRIIAAERSSVEKLKRDIKKREEEIECLKSRVQRLEEEVKKRDQIARKVRDMMEKQLSTQNNGTDRAAPEFGWRRTASKEVEKLKRILLIFVVVLLLVVVTLII